MWLELLACRRAGLSRLIQTAVLLPPPVESAYFNNIDRQGTGLAVEEYCLSHPAGYAGPATRRVAEIFALQSSNSDGSWLKQTLLGRIMRELLGDVRPAVDTRTGGLNRFSQASSGETSASGQNVFFITSRLPTISNFASGISSVRSPIFFPE